MPGSAQPVFVADSFGKAFGKTKVLRAASCWARPGRITLLLGRNGSGKTTLLKAALGLIRADYGVVRWRDRYHVRPRLALFARSGLFFLPDQGFLSPRLRVGEHFSTLQKAFPAVGIRDAGDMLCVQHLASFHPPELSGGERRRVELSLALARKPVCLIADEPLLGIAPRDQALVVAALRSLVAGDCAMIITGHEVDRLLDLADEVVWMVHGSTYALGSPKEAVEHYQFSREYLGRP